MRKYIYYTKEHFKSEYVKRESQNRDEFIDDILYYYSIGYEVVFNRLY